ncbi:MAG TPA: TolC family protein [Candidatus Kapabacteria bacterium]|nr:TolC family protein [Candidatus Kapabacteria bacterium]
MTRLALVLPIVALAALPSLLEAQTATPLSMSDAISTAMSNNRQLAISRMAIDNADQQVREAYSGTLPSVTLNGRYTRNIQKQVFYFPGSDGITRPIKIGSDNQVAADITVNQIVYNSAAFNAPDAAESYAKVSRQQLRADAVQTVYDVKRAYYGALLAREALRVNEALLANSEENLKNAQQLVKAGLRPEFDQLRAQVQVENLRPVVVQARDSYQQAIDNLKLLLGYTPDHDITLSDSLMRPAAGQKVEPGIAEATATLEQSNAQVQTLKALADVNREYIEIKRSDYLPTVSLFGTYQLQSQSDNFSGLSFQPSSYVGLNLSYNLFSGGKTDAQMQEARLAWEQSKVKVLQAQDAMKTQLGIVLRKIDVARQRVGTADMTITEAQRAYTIATTAYKAGTGTQLQISDADLALAQSRLNQLNAVYDYSMALAELEQLMGDRFQMNGSKDVQYLGK